MADQVTISTFLELRDNLSGGIKNVTAQLEALRSTAVSAQTAMEQLGRASRFAATMQTASMTSVTRSANIATASAKAVSQGYGVGVVNSIRQVRYAALALQYAVTGFIGVQAVKSVIKLNEEFENLRFRIAGTIMASKLASNIDIAEKKSERVLGTLRTMAAKLPGEAQEYAGAFAMALPKLLASGMTNLTKAADFVSRYTAVAISNGVDAAQAGRDLMLMLSGRAGMQVKTFTVLSEKIGMTAKDFNRLNAEVRRQKIEEALKPYEGLLAKVSEGFTAKFGELKTTFSDIIRLGSTPLFAGAKSALSEINSWLLKNKDALIATGKVISRDVMSGLHVVGALAAKLGEHFDSIWSTTRLIFELWVSAKIVGGIAAAINAFRRLRSIITAVKVESILAARASSAMGASVPIPGGPPAKTPTPRGGGWWGAALQLGVTGFMEYEARREEQAAAAKEREEAFAPSRKFGEVFKKQTGGKYFGAAPEIQVAKELDEFRKRFKVKEAFGTEELFEEVVKRQKEIKAAGLAELASPEIMRAYGELKGFDYELAKMKAEGTFEPPSVPSAPAAPGVRGAVANYDFRNSRFDIKQEFAEGFDPDRIAAAFATDLSMLGEMKLQANFGHIGMVR